MRPRGLRNLRTLQGVVRRDKAGSREQVVAEFARLEHEKSRLQREIDIWEQNRRRTNEQLHLVESRLIVLRQAIELAESPRPNAASRDDPSSDPHWSSVILEY